MRRNYIIGSIIFYILAVFFFVYGYIRRDFGAFWIITVALFVITASVYLYYGLKKK